MKTPTVSTKKGGFALKNTGVTRIRREDIPATVQYVSKLSGIPTKDLHLLGSVGKTSDSGDVDLGVDSKKYSVADVQYKMCSVLGTEKCKRLPGIDVSSYAIPIAGDPSKGLVQVDLMFSETPDWLTFAYHSPGNQSEYKGAVRTMLLMGVAATHKEHGTDYFEYNSETGELAVRAGRTLDLNNGLRRIFQYRPKSKTGDRYLKNMKTISTEEFIRVFPNVDIREDNMIIDNPQEVLTMLFGPGVEPKDVNTAEQVIWLINERFDHERQVFIFKKVAERARAVTTKMKIPPEIKEYIE